MVALVLHAGVERDHREVVGVGDRVDVAGKPKRKRRERHDLREPSARRAALDVERRAARRLANAADDLLPEFAEAFDEAERRRRLSLAEGGRGDCRDVDVLALPPRAYALKHLCDVDLGKDLAVGRPLVLLKPQLLCERGGGFEILFGSLCDLPVLHLRRIKLHAGNYTINQPRCARMLRASSHGAIPRPRRRTDTPRIFGIISGNV